MSMELKPLRQGSVQAGYKQTEVGVIPEEWDAKPLKGKISISHGFPFASEHYTGHGSYRLTTPGHFYENGGFRDISDKQKFYDGPVPNAYVLSPGDLIVAMTEQADGLLGSAAFIPKVEGYLHNQRLGRVKALSSEVELGFLFYVFNSPGYRAKVRETAAGTKVKHTSPEKLLEISVRFPPPHEQRAIAGALSDVDALIGALDQLIAKKRDLKQAAIHQLLTGHTRLPGFHGEWGVKALGELFTFGGGFSASRDQLSFEGHCYLHYGDIHKSSKTFIDVRSDYQDIPKLDIPLKRISQVSLLEDGDVVFVDASEDDEGTSRHVVIVNKDKTPYISGLHTIVAKSKTNELDHQYRRYCFQTTDIRQQFYFYAVGTKVSGISKSNITKLTIPVPSLSEQAAIAEVLSDMDAEIATLEQRRDKTRDLKQAMMQELLTGRVRLI
jgi:type I restriction enzyme S subunit